MPHLSFTPKKRALLQHHSIIPSGASFHQQKGQTYKTQTEKGNQSNTTNCLKGVAAHNQPTQIKHCTQWIEYETNCNHSSASLHLRQKTKTLTLHAFHHNQHVKRVYIRIEK